MCGIVGIVDSHSNVDAEQLRCSAETLRLRGPDDSGVWTCGNVGLGHQRLAVIDISPTGHQPMLSGDGRFVIVFNGEIYNFREVRRQLDQDETHWRSQSDTEVILAAYARWGPDCLQRFHGMFSLAIWDQREKSLFAARDRMGVKPFYYHHSGDCFAFGSRPRALLALRPKLSQEIDEQALRLYLESGYVPSPYSIYREIRKLPPAHWLRLDHRGLHIERYWDFRGITPELSWEGRREDDLLDELDSILSRSVRSRMISDVPLGAFLSGGIDSSLIVAMMAKHSSRPVETFTIGFDEKVFDESKHARAVSGSVRTNHHCEHLKVDDLLSLMPTFSEEYDEPFFDSSAFPTMAVSRFARRHVTVVLTGDGGDELFGGYHYYQIAHKLRPFFRMPSGMRNAGALLIGNFPQHRAQLLSGVLRQRSALDAFCFTRSIRKDFEQLLPPEVLRRTMSMRDLFTDASKPFPKGLTTAEKGMRLDAYYTLPDEYLQKVDVASMAFSLEAREPLLDQDVVEWAMKLPLKWKLRGRQSKYLLRKLAYRYISKEILNRPKQGFEVPMVDWLRGPLRAWAASRLGDAERFGGTPLNQSRIIELFELHASRKRNVHPLLWAVLTFLGFVPDANQIENVMAATASDHGI
jgi:asparagine synthase (glutamine-hydrolysing)